MSDRYRDEHARLEKQADLTRARLMETLEAIDRRRHLLLDVRHQLESHKTPLVIAASVLTSVLGAGIGLAIYRLSHRDERRRRERYEALQRYWKHPERVGRYKDRPFFVDFLRKVAMGTLTFAAMQLARTALKRAVPQLKAAESPNALVLQ